MSYGEVILVNKEDVPTGVLEKMEAHQKGLLHRAFSIFIFNSRGEMLLQQRAAGKYHSGGLWTNACCSHPRPGESTLVAAQRRLTEEMGFTVALEKIFDFIYKYEFENGLTEHEFDHVWVGEYSGQVFFNKEEVMEVCYKSMDEIAASLLSHPRLYTAWFHLAFPKISQWWDKQYGGSIA